MTRKSLILGFCFFVVLCGPLAVAEESYSVEVISNNITIDRKYYPMRGPVDEQKFTLLETAEPELLWLIKARVEPMGPVGAEQYLCHTAIALDLGRGSTKKHNALFATATHMASPRLLGFVQGQLATKLPEGFGMPIRSDELLVVRTMVMNDNELVSPIQVKFKTVVGFRRDRDLEKPLKPLFHRFIALKVEQDGHFSSMWDSEPGRHVYRYSVNPRLDLPFDTTLHYIGAHLHPFGESLEFRDLTTGETIYKTYAVNYEDRPGIAYLDSFSSEEGIQLFKDHEYEIVAVYNNTTDKAQPAMGMFRLYFLDRGFQ